MPSIRELLGRIQHYPPLLGDCLLCHQATQCHSLLCNECHAELPRIVHPCPRCGFPLPEAGNLCGSCLQHPPAWDRLRIVADYQAPYLQLIHQLKYAGKIECATLLGRLFCEASKTVPSEAGDKRPNVLLPVPLHWWRQWRRGYNQADACRIGMHLHGLAGDLAIKEIGKESLIASDLIQYLPKAFLRMED